MMQQCKANKNRNIATLVEFAKTSVDYKEINFGFVPNYIAQEINREIGLKINGSLKILSSFAIMHILKEHGCGCGQEDRGQVSVTEKDFDNVPLIFSSYDSVSYGGKNTKRKDCLIFKKRINGLLYHMVACFSEAKSSHTQPGNKLFVNTLYIKK